MSVPVYTSVPLRSSLDGVVSPGFDPDHPHVDYLKLKSFFVWTEVKLDLNAPDQLVPRLAQGFQDAYALVSWLRSVPEPQQEATNE